VRNRSAWRSLKGFEVLEEHALFGNAGTLMLDFFGSEDGAESIVTRSDGKLVVAGLARNQSSTRLGLARVIP
jgi:hypothetical protein